MKTILKIELVIILILLVLNINGYLSYGYGLADIFYIGRFMVYLFIIGAIHFLIKKDWITIILIFLLIVYTLLLMTIYRGVENAWDGNIFVK